MPPKIWGAPPTENGGAYEPYLIRLIRMASLALDDLFVSKLRAALAPLGDSVTTEIDDGKPVIRVRRDGKPLIDIQVCELVYACVLLPSCVPTHPPSLLCFVAARSGQVGGAHAQQTRQRGRPQEEAAAPAQVECRHGARV